MSQWTLPYLLLKNSSEESFVDFIPLKGKAAGAFTEIMSKLIDDGLINGKLHGQRNDNAAIMS